MNRENIKSICDAMQAGHYKLGVLEKFFEADPDDQTRDEIHAIDVMARMRRDHLAFDDAFRAHLDALAEELAASLMSSFRTIARAK
ncbi:hypothetical protein [uncultured Jatrophihabitans sp.]|uniref:hypothetical protein n=1 Tax=uncultured Jatrophihabitans sp. TaxID=1610747 RepID=UPI0035CC4DF7